MYINIPGDMPFSIKHAVDDDPMQRDFPMHAHSHFELLYFVSGDITFLVEGSSYRPKPQDLLVFDIAETHRVVVNSAERYERIVLQFEKNFFADIDPQGTLLAAFTSRKVGEGNIIPPQAFSDDLWRKCIFRLAQKEAPSRAEVYPYLLPLLKEIGSIETAAQKESGEMPLQSAIIRYVNEHIAQDLSPAEVAKRFYLSRTALYQLFKEATGTGIHNYINVKRLIIAREMLKSGESPTKVYEKCGFKDYTTFFRAYKAHFAVSPKEDSIKIK